MNLIRSVPAKCKGSVGLLRDSQRGLLRLPGRKGLLHSALSGQSGLLRHPGGKERSHSALLAQHGLLRDPNGRGLWRVAPPGQSGFTLIEIMIVLAIVGILLTMAEPSYHTQIIKARETSLKKSLFVMRDVVDQFAADQGRYPDSLQMLVDDGYLRALPIDPFTRSSDTWIEVREDTKDNEDSPGIFDVHSGSDLVATDGTAYNQW